MQNNISSLDEWWSHLSEEQKCHIGTKVYHDDIVSGREATRIWLLLTEEQKSFIKEHCTIKHGMIISEWQEGFPCSF